MFMDFYGLREQPFGVTPDTKYLFWSASHREAMASIYYGIESDRGFVTLIAPPGTGKTTLLFHLLERLRRSSRTAFLFQTQCSSRELLGYIMTDIGCDVSGQDVVSLQGKLNAVLIEEARAGKRFVLIIDEAQNLEISVLETIRLLSNFETPSRKLMQIILAGQPQLARNLARKDLMQLRQRISLMARIDPLNPCEVREYLEHRLRIAGYRGALPFTEDALAIITSASQGIPRTVNNLCFNALTLGYAQRRKKVNASIVHEVLSDLKIIDPSPDEDFRPINRLSSSRVATSVVLLILASSLFFSQRQAPPVSAPKPPSAPTPEQFLTITVEAGETLGSLSRKYLNRDWDQQMSEKVMQLNGEIKDPNLIRSGMIIRLPLNGATSPLKQ